MDANALINHLAEHHGINQHIAREVIAGAVQGEAQDEEYMRGFHDGMHGRVDADDLDEVGHA